jgi:hypothetical protein
MNALYIAKIYDMKTYFDDLKKVNKDRHASPEKTDAVTTPKEEPETLLSDTMTKG